MLNRLTRTQELSNILETRYKRLTSLLNSEPRSKQIQDFRFFEGLSANASSLRRVLSRAA